MVTVPGEAGVVPAFAGEFGISFAQMLLVLSLSNTPRVARFTGICAAGMLMTAITLESPLSGTSMNPARTLATMWVCDNWTGWWIYLSAPPLGMLTAAQLFLWLRGRSAILCAKLHHQNRHRCLFCEYGSSLKAKSPPVAEENPKDLTCSP